MEPIASSGAGAVLRSGAGQASDSHALLRDGRVLTAEVLARSGDGTLLLAIGRHVIPAESELALDPGARFVVRVEGDGEGAVLQLVGAAADPEEALLAALRRVVGEERPLGEPLAELARALRAATNTKEGALPPEAQALARALGAFATSTSLAGGAEGLRASLFALGLGHEAALAALLGARGARASLAELRGNLKARLLAAEAALAGAPERELHQAVARALASLEAEQLLNLARERAGEPVVLSLPLADAEGFATARLFVPAREERAAGEDGAPPAPFRLALELELSRLGPLRVELALAPARLAVSVRVTRPETRARLAAELGELRARLERGPRALELEVRLVAPGELAPSGGPFDIRYLHERRLMDVRG
jgi:hypothetical protein